MRLLPLDHLETLARQIHASIDAKELEDKLAYILSHYGLINIEFNYSHPFFRAVRCDNDRGFSNVGRISHPPPYLTKAGRLNEAGAPLLYTSINQYTPFEEIGLQTGDFVQVATFKLKIDATLRAGIVGEAVRVQRSGGSAFPEKMGLELANFLSKLDLEAGKSYLYTDALLSSILRDPHASTTEYIKSRILSRLLFDSDKTNLDAIQYPSVPHEGAMNLAIRPSAANKKLTLSSTFVLHIKKRFDYAIYDVETVRIARGQHSDGSIDWN